jgi:hypothetical protein
MLAVGTAGYVLQTNGAGAPTWVAAATGDVTLTGTQTLTNKTLTAPTIASANLTTALTLAGAAGTNGQVLTSAGSGLPTWTTVGSGALTLLSTVTASASATVDIESTFSSTYDSYMLVGTGITAANDGVNLFAQMKLGGAYDTGANYVFHTQHSTSAATTYQATNSAGATSIRIFGGDGISNNASASGNFTMYISNPSSTALRKQIYFTGSCVSYSLVHIHACGSGHNTATTALTGIRLFLGSGNITSGKFRLYGISNS